MPDHTFATTAGCEQADLRPAFAAGEQLRVTTRWGAEPPLAGGTYRLVERINGSSSAPAEVVVMAPSLAAQS